MTLYLTNPIDGSRWAVVPVEATEEMCTAHEMADIEDNWRDAHAYQQDSWDVMLAAAPKFPIEAMGEKVAKIICGRPELGECDDVEKYFAEATHHSGDCTKETHTCILCRVEMYRDIARDVIAGLFEVKNDEEI